MENLNSETKYLFHAFFASLGLRVFRLSNAELKGGEKYFNASRLMPLQENSLELYERFYVDHAALQEHYDETRLAFYTAVSERMCTCGLVLDGKDLLDVGCGTVICSPG